MAQKLWGPDSLLQPCRLSVSVCLSLWVQARFCHSLTLSICAVGDCPCRLCAWPVLAAGATETDSAPAAPGCGAGCVLHKSTQLRG